MTHLDLKMGTFNTVVLLTSSLSMALSVHFAQLKKSDGTSSLASCGNHGVSGGIPCR